MPHLPANEALTESEPAPQIETPVPVLNTSTAEESPQTQTQQGTAQPEPSFTPASTPASTSTERPQGPLPFSKTDDRQENLVAPRNILMLLLTKARLVTQLCKHKKLLKIMGLFARKSHITNDDVEKLLHVSDATALRYLTQLKKENKIIQNGKTGQGVICTKK